MPGLHCTDCVYGEFSYNEEWGKYQGSCSRGYRLCDPHETQDPHRFFSEKPEGLVPTIDPFGKEYLRDDNVCPQFVHSADGTVDKSRRFWNRT